MRKLLLSVIRRGRLLRAKHAKLVLYHYPPQTQRIEKTEGV